MASFYSSVNFMRFLQILTLTTAIVEDHGYKGLEFAGDDGARADFSIGPFGDITAVVMESNRMEHRVSNCGQGCQFIYQVVEPPDALSQEGEGKPM